MRWNNGEQKEDMNRNLVSCGSKLSLVNRIPQFFNRVKYIEKWEWCNNKTPKILSSYGNDPIILQPCSIGNPLAQAGVQRWVLVDEAVISDTAIKMDERRTESGQKTLLAIIADLFQIDEVRADDGGVHRIVIAQLYLYPLTKRREHLSEDYLLVPHRSVAVSLHAGFPLKRAEQKNCYRYPAVLRLTVFSLRMHRIRIYRSDKCVLDDFVRGNKI